MPFTPPRPRPQVALTLVVLAYTSHHRSYSSAPSASTIPAAKTGRLLPRRVLSSAKLDQMALLVADGAGSGQAAHSWPDDAYSSLGGLSADVAERLDAAAAAEQALEDELAAAADGEAAAEEKLAAANGRAAVADELAVADGQAADRQRAAAADLQELTTDATATKQAAADRQAALDKQAAEEMQAAVDKQAAADRQAEAEKLAAANMLAAEEMQASADRQAAAEKQAAADRQAAEEMQVAAAIAAAAVNEQISTAKLLQEVGRRYPSPAPRRATRVH